jgi:hypothetical protein
MIDEEAARVVSAWVKLGDRVTGRKTDEGTCDECGSQGYVTRDGGRRICARCYLDNGPSAA